jgi:Flp pilus assembly protein TadG
MNRMRGSTSSELVILLPVLMLVILLVVYLGRITQTSTSLQHIADVAARDASQASIGNSVQIARMSAQRELKMSDVRCESVVVETKQTRSNGFSTVNVQLSCRASLEEMSILSFIPLTIIVTSSSVIDRYRSS